MCCILTEKAPHSLVSKQVEHTWRAKHSCAISSASRHVKCIQTAIAQGDMLMTASELLNEEQQDGRTFVQVAHHY
jgi:hypothetical protein